MTSLTTVLENQDKIKALIKDFGYSDRIKIYNGGDDPERLKLIVYQNGKDIFSKDAFGEKIRTYLQVKLIYLLDCEVLLAAYERIPTLSIYDVDDKSVDLFDQAGLKNLFETENLDTVTFDAPNKNKTRIRARILEKAQKYLEEEKKEEQNSQVSTYGNTSSLRNQPSLFTNTSTNNVGKKRSSSSGSPESIEKKLRITKKDPKIEVNPSKHMITWTLPTEGLSKTTLSAISEPKVAMQLAQRMFSLFSEEIAGITKSQEVTTEKKDTNSKTPTC